MALPDKPREWIPGSKPTTTWRPTVKYPPLTSNVTSPEILDRVQSSISESQASVIAENDLFRVIYGEPRVGAQILNVLTSGGNWIIQVVWGWAGALGYDSINSFAYNDSTTLPAGMSVTHYLGTQVTPNATLVSAFAARGITYSDSLNKISYSVIVASPEALGGNLSFSARVKGMKVYDPRTALTVWSKNPTLCLRDFITNTDYGVGKTVNDTTVIEAANWNDTVVEQGIPRCTISLAIDRAAAAGEWIEVLRTYAEAFVHWTNGSYKIIADKPRAAVHSLTHEDGHIKNIPAVVKRGLDDVPSVVWVIYTDTSAIPHREDRVPAWASSEVENGLAPYRESVVRLPGVTNRAEAYRHGVSRLNKLSINDLIITVEAFDEAAQFEIGDVVDFSFSPYGIEKEMQVASSEMREPGRWMLGLQEYSEAAFSNAVIAPENFPDTDLPDPNSVPSVTALSLVEEYYQEASHKKWTTRMRATWTAPDWYYPVVYEVTLWQLASGAEEVFQRAVIVGNEFTSVSVLEGLSYRIDVATRGPISVSSVVSATAFAAGNTLPPTDVQNLSGSEAGGKVLLKWSAAIDLSTIRYEIREGDTSDTWESANLVDRVDALSYLTQGFPAGERRFFVKAFDSLGLYSTNAAIVDVEISVDDAAFKALTFTPTSWSLLAARSYLGEDGKTYAYTDFADPIHYGYTDASNTVGTFDDDAGAPTILASEGLVVDIDTSTVLFSKNPTTVRPMASTTKVMTLLVACEVAAADMDGVQTFNNALMDPGGDSAGLENGANYLLGELLYAMIMPSGNDAANAIAEYVGRVHLGAAAGSAAIARFVTEMNTKAAALGMSDTNYENAHGLDETGHESTVTDMVKLITAATANSLAATVLNTHDYYIDGSIPGGEDHLFDNSTTPIYRYAGCNASKAGTTFDSLSNIAVAERGGKRLALACNQDGGTANNRPADMRAMWDYGFRELGIFDDATHEVHEGAAHITRTGSWSRTGFFPAVYDGSGFGYFTSSSGAKASFTFTGSKIQFYAPKGSGRGIAGIYIDGVFDQNVDQYNATTLFSMLQYEKTWATPGTHTFEIRYTGTKNASSSGTLIAYDKWIVTDSCIEASEDSPVTGSTIFTQPHSSALNFDGSTSYVNIPHASGLSPTSAGTFSFDAWVFPTDATEGVRHAVYSTRLANPSGSWSIEVGANSTPAGSGRLMISAPAGISCTASGAVPLREWSHICVSVSANVATLYVNGVAIAKESADAVTYANNSDAKRLGVGRSGNLDWFKGLISRPRLWNVALSAGNVLDCMQYRGTDVTSVINAGNLVAANLRASWLLDDQPQGSIITTCADQKAVSNGTVNGTIDWRSWDEVISAPIDLGEQFAATFEITKSPTALVGSTGIALLLSSDGNIYTETAGQTVVGAGRFAKIKMQAQGGSAIYDLTDTGVRINLVPRDEVHTITSSASGATTVTLKGSYSQALNITLQPKFNATYPIITCLYDEVEVSAGRGIGSGTVLKLAGGTDRVRLASNANVAFERTDSFTVECWIKSPPAAPGANLAIINKLNWNVGAKGWRIHGTEAGIVTFALTANHTVTDVVLHSPVVLDNIWHHIAVTYAGANNTAKMYVDGVLVTSGGGGSNATTTIDAAVPLEVGSHNDVGTNFYVGRVDDVRIWKGVVRTQEEIAANMNAEIAAPQANLVLYWKFNDGSGSSVADVSGNGYTGTISGTTYKWRPYDGFDVYAYGSALASYAPVLIANEIRVNWKGA